MIDLPVAAVAPRASRKSRIGRLRSYITITALTLGTLLGAFAMLIPVLWMISLAFKPQSEIFTIHPQLLPQAPTLDNFVQGWERSGFSRFFANSLFVTSTRVILSVIINSLAGFGFAKYRFVGREFLFFLMLTSMMIPEQVRMIPLYTLFVNLNWINTLQSVIVPGVGLTFGAFIMRQYLSSIPDELIEAARIDGSSELRVFTQIIIPLSVPALVVNALFQFVWGWNDLLWPLLFLQTENMYTVQLALANFQGDESVTGGPIMAMSLLSALPVLFVYVLLQRHFIRGIALTGIKG